MNIIEKLNYIKENQYVVNSKFYVVVHLPLQTWYDFDLVFFSDSGTIIYRQFIQNQIKDIEIVDERKVAYIIWKD
jgi:hypothetical protein